LLNISCAGNCISLYQNSSRHCTLRHPVVASSAFWIISLAFLYDYHAH
jgi:hypothetical protein